MRPRKRTGTPSSTRPGRSESPGILAVVGRRDERSPCKSVILAAGTKATSMLKRGEGGLSLSLSLGSPSLSIQGFGRPSPSTPGTLVSPFAPILLPIHVSSAAAEEIVPEQISRFVACGALLSARAKRRGEREERGERDSRDTHGEPSDSRDRTGPRGRELAAESGEEERLSEQQGELPKK